jgi:hypothetical protein
MKDKALISIFALKIKIKKSLSDHTNHMILFSLQRIINRIIIIIIIIIIFYLSLGY